MAMKARLMPIPNGIPARAVGTHDTLGCDVHANQKSDTGMSTDAGMALTRCCSGGGW